MFRLIIALILLLTSVSVVKAEETTGQKYNTPVLKTRLLSKKEMLFAERERSKINQIQDKNNPFVTWEKLIIKSIKK